MEPFYRYLVYLVIVSVGAALIDSSHAPSILGKILALFTIGAVPAAHLAATWYADAAIRRFDRRRAESWPEFLLFVLVFVLAAVLLGVSGTAITALLQWALKSRPFP